VAAECRRCSEWDARGWATASTHWVSCSCCAQNRRHTRTASVVMLATCGVRRTLGCRHSGLSCGSGSEVNTSSSAKPTYACGRVAVRRGVVDEWSHRRITHGRSAPLSHQGTHSPSPAHSPARCPGRAAGLAPARACRGRR
jgi:hypothetical protein